MRSLRALSFALLAAIPHLSAQTGLAPASAPAPAPGEAPICYRARPKPACSGFLFTNFGTYVTLGGTQPGGTPLRLVADWGAMVNVGRHNAFGLSVFPSLDENTFQVGVAARYRRWLRGSSSLDLAVGTPLVSSNGMPGSILGLAKWNAGDWFGFAVRPEVAREEIWLGCDSSVCRNEVRNHLRVSAGMEFGRVPGAVLTGLGVVATFLAALAYAGVD